MRILPMLLALIATSCVLRVIETGQIKDGNDKGTRQGVVPAGCIEQLDFVREEVESRFMGKPSIVHKRYSYKDEHGCETAVTISRDLFHKDPIAFMNDKEISCSVADEGSLVLSFSHDKDNRHSEIKFPCNTKKISIVRVMSWNEVRKFAEDYKLSKLALEQNPNLGMRLKDWMLTSMAHLTVAVGRGYGELFSKHYKTFQKEIMDGISIIYTEHQQGSIINPISRGILRKPKVKKHPHGAVGVSKEGVVVFHIKVDSKGKEQMLYPSEEADRRKNQD